MTCDIDKTYVTSDHHFGSSLMPGPFRAFTLEQEDELVQKWNDVVKDDDLVLYNGDFSDCSIKQLIKYRNRLSGHVILIKGNHDTLPDFFYRELFDDVVSSLHIDNLDLHVSHKPLEKPGVKQIYGHMHRGYVVRPLDRRYSFCSCVQASGGFPVLLRQVAEQLRLQTH